MAKSAHAKCVEFNAEGAAESLQAAKRFNVSFQLASFPVARYCGGAGGASVTV